MTHAEQCERRKQIADAIANGDSRSEVAQKFNVCDNTIGLACRTYSIPFPPGVLRNRQYERRVEIAKAVAEGVMLIEVSQRFKVSLSTIRNACRQFGTRIPSNIDLTARAKRHPFDVLAKLRIPHKLDSEVAMECGLTRERVNQIKKRAREAGLLDGT